MKYLPTARDLTIKGVLHINKHNNIYTRNRKKKKKNAITRSKHWYRT